MKKRALTSLMWIVALWIIAGSLSRADGVLVSAAASLTESLKEMGMAFTKVNPRTTVRFNFGSSGALQQQIEQGAPVDVFVSASDKEMGALQKSNRIETATRTDFAGNLLVLITPSQSRVKVQSWEDLKSPSVRRVAISHPDSVPSGRYAREALTKRGLWAAVQPKAVLGENVRQTLMYVAHGDVEAGLVFATDARIEPKKVRVVKVAAPGKDHAPIVYSAVVVTGAPNAPAARRFVAFLQSPAAQAILARNGFTFALPQQNKTRRSRPGAHRQNGCCCHRLRSSAQHVLRRCPEDRDPLYPDPSWMAARWRSWYTLSRNVTA